MAETWWSTRLVALLEDAGTTEQRTHRVGRLRANAQPVVHAVLLQIDGRVAEETRLILANDLDETPVTGGLRVSNDDTVHRGLLPAFAAESDCYCHSNIFLSLGLKVSFELDWLVNL